MLYVIQICKQNENAGKNIHIQTHQQSMKLIIRIGKMHTDVQFFIILILMLYYVIVIEVIYCSSLSIQYYQKFKYY